MYRFLWNTWTLLLFTFFAEPERLLVGKKTAAAMLGVCPRTISNLLRMKSLPARRIGRRTLISVQALRKFVRHDHLESPANFSRRSSAEEGEQR